MVDANPYQSPREYGKREELAAAEDVETVVRPKRSGVGPAYLLAAILVAAGANVGQTLARRVLLFESEFAVLCVRLFCAGIMLALFFLVRNRKRTDRDPYDEFEFPE